MLRELGWMPILLGINEMNFNIQYHLYWKSARKNLTKSPFENGRYSNLAREAVWCEYKLLSSAICIEKVPERIWEIHHLRTDDIMPVSLRDTNFYTLIGSLLRGA